MSTPAAPEHVLGDVTEVEAWASCGAMALTGRPGRPPLGPPAGLVPRLRSLGVSLAGHLHRRAGAPEVDPLALLGERAAIAGLTRGGDASCGRAARLLPAADGWIAVSLPREADLDAVPAWLELGGVVPGAPADVWAAVRAEVHSRSAATLVERGRLLGMAVAALPGDERSTRRAAGRVPGARFRHRGGPRHGTSGESLLVVDLSSLWAGPLCSHLLQQAGMRVVKVESSARPDGARRGAPAFFDLLNQGKQSVALDFALEADRRWLRRLLRAADVVVEASRPRALEQLGIVAHECLADGTRVWTSITGYGRDEPGRDWVAFGDDAAVAGGLVVWDERGPCFCADAVADPLAGITAAVAVLDALDDGRPQLVDVAMRDVAAGFAGPTLAAGPGCHWSPPSARPTRGRGPRIGEHTDEVLRTL